MSDTELLITRLRTWPLGEIGREAADEIERLRLWVSEAMCHLSPDGCKAANEAAKSFDSSTPESEGE